MGRASPASESVAIERTSVESRDNPRPRSTSCPRSCGEGCVPGDNPGGRKKAASPPTQTSVAAVATTQARLRELKERKGQYDWCSPVALLEETGGAGGGGIRLPSPRGLASQPCRLLSGSCCWLRAFSSFLAKVCPWKRDETLLRNIKSISTRSSDQKFQIFTFVLVGNILNFYSGTGMGNGGRGSSSPG